MILGLLSLDDDGALGFFTLVVTTRAGVGGFLELTAAADGEELVSDCCFQPTASMAPDD